MLGLGLIAALAVATMTAAGASALPEFGKCEAKAGGKYSDSNCTKKAAVGTGKFEWHNSLSFTKNQKEFSNGTGEKVPAVLITKFQLEEAGRGVLEAKVECESIFDLGEFSSKSSKEVRSVHVKFSGCKTLGAPCGNTSVEGVIETNLLKGLVGYIKKAAPKEVGIDIKPQSGKQFAQFSCSGAVTIAVGEATEAEGPFYPPKGGGDGVIGAMTPVNQMTNSFTQAFTANEETDQNIPSKFEGQPLQVLEDRLLKFSKWSPAGQTVTVHNSCRACTGEEGVGEIKA
jgi:hypothetical protein